MTTSPNVLLVVLDSVRARNTSLHDHRRATTPALDSLADRATVYTQARAPDRWSLPSHVSMFTGFAPPEHEVTQKGDRLVAGNSIFEDLADAGYATGVFSENPFLTELETGIPQMFDTVEGKSTEPLYPNAVDPHEFEGDILRFLSAAVRSGKPLRAVLNGVTTKLAWDFPELVPERIERKISGGVSRGERYTDLFLEWERDQNGPWAACINYMDAHHPYAPHDEYNTWADDTVASILDAIETYPGDFYTRPEATWRCEIAELLYDGTIRQVDAEVGRLVDSLQERNVLDDTLLVVTADHGEGFGEASRLRPIQIAGHAVGGHEVNLHVPLVVKYPGQRTSKQVTDPVSLMGFPEAVQAVRNGAGDGVSDLFVSDDPVVATGSEADAELIDHVQDAGRDPSALEVDVEVVYEPGESGSVVKHMRWQDSNEAVRVFDARTTTPIDDTNGGVVESVFDSLTPAGIAEDGQIDGVDHETMQRLEQLGYR